MKNLFVTKLMLFTMLLLVFNKFLYAVEYNCPKLPLKAKIGTHVDGEWYLGYDWGERPGVIKKYYNKHFGRQYIFDKWAGLKRVNYSEGRSTKVMCCGAFENGGSMLCITRDIVNMNCESLLFDEDVYAFKCEKT